MSSFYWQNTRKLTIAAVEAINTINFCLSCSGKDDQLTHNGQCALFYSRLSPVGLPFHDL